MSSFQREERYIVIKLSDLTDEEYEDIEGYLERNIIEQRECVVVEAHWPIYEEVWNMIEGLSNEKVK
jgi:hypothetical protein